MSFILSNFEAEKKSCRLMRAFDGLGFCKKLVVVTAALRQTAKQKDLLEQGAREGAGLSTAFPDPSGDRMFSFMLPCELLCL